MREDLSTAVKVNPLTAAVTLQLWEASAAQSAVQRSLALLVAATGAEFEQLAQLSIGRRDALLLQLRALTFGAEFSSVVSCPQCNEKLELNFGLKELLAAANPAVEATLSQQIDGYDLCFRVPNSADLLALPAPGAMATAREFLLARCLLTAERNADTVRVEQLPEVVVKAIVTKMEQADPLADIRFDLRCAQCQHTWQAGFDIGSYFWTEIDAWAQRTLREIHVLASAYGWSETQILALSPARRQTYLNLIGK